MLSVKLTYTKDIETDLEEIYAYYSDFGVDIVLSLDSDFNAFEKFIKEYPEGRNIRYKNIRRVNLHKFPYAFFYVYNEEDMEVILLRCLHQHRHPAVWPK